jgi:hypothetical protein
VRIAVKVMSGSLKRSSKKKEARAGKRPGSPVPNQLRNGMPASDSVRKVVDFRSPQGVKYKILKTTEMDAYDQLPQPKKKRR